MVKNKITGHYSLDIRKFNGEWYGPMKQTHRTKQEANATAKVVRKLGIKARVLNSDKGYAVYCNESDVKRASSSGALKPRKRR